MVYCGLFEQGEKIRAIVYAGDEISKEKSAGDIVKSISQILGGAGGGSAKFAQGGGTDKSKNCKKRKGLRGNRWIKKKFQK